VLAAAAWRRLSLEVTGPAAPFPEALPVPPGRRSRRKNGSSPASQARIANCPNVPLSGPEPHLAG